MQTAKSIDERAGETHKGRTRVPRTKTTRALALLLALILLGGLVSVSYTHLTLPTTPYV